jgi:hypothetical protein
MRQQIRKFGVGQTAKVVGVLYALIGLLFIPFFFIMSSVAPKQTGFGAGFAFVVPIMYGVFGFIGTAIACALYNMVAKWVGGIEVETDGGIQGGV